MRRLVLLLMMTFLSLFLAACGSNSDSDSGKEVDNTGANQTEPEKETSSGEQNDIGDKSEVEAYLKEALTISLEVDELGQRWDEIRNASANGEVDDAELGTIIHEEIIPLNMELLERIEEVDPPNEQTVEANEVFIDMMGNQQLAFTEILSAIETGDSSKITSANSLLNDVRKSERDLVRKLETIIEEYDIVIE